MLEQRSSGFSPAELRGRPALLSFSEREDLIYHRPIRFGRHTWEIYFGADNHRMHLSIHQDPDKSDQIMNILESFRLPRCRRSRASYRHNATEKFLSHNWEQIAIDLVNNSSVPDDTADIESQFLLEVSLEAHFKLLGGKGVRTPDGIARDPYGRIFTIEVGSDLDMKADQARKQAFMLGALLPPEIPVAPVVATFGKFDNGVRELALCVL